MLKFHISTKNIGILYYITNKILKISMKRKKNSMFYLADIVYSVNINKRHGRKKEKVPMEGRIFT